jgi:hypothetical protein
MRRAALKVVVIGLLCVGLIPAGVTGASATGGVQGLEATPKPPKVVEVSWDAYPDFPVDHYEVSLEPGMRFQTTSSTVASFNDLNWGVTYKAQVVAVGSAGDRSPSSTLTIAGTKLTTEVVETPVFRGQRSQFVGELTTRSGEPISGGTVIIQVDPSGSPVDYTTLGSRTTSGSGEFGFSVRTLRNSVYRVLYRGIGTAGGWAYASARVKARMSLSIDPNPVSSGRRAVFTGRVKAPAELVRGERVELQRLRGGQWNALRVSAVANDGTYRFTRRLRADGQSTWRVFMPSHTHFVTSLSPTRVLTVR